MKRDMMKIAEEGRKNIPEGYQLEMDELRELMAMVYRYDDVSEGLWNVFGILFRYGFQLGRRCEKRHGRKLPAKVMKGYKKMAAEQISGMTDRQAELVCHFITGLSGADA